MGVALILLTLLATTITTNLEQNVTARGKSLAKLMSQTCKKTLYNILKHPQKSCPNIGYL